jgi:DNA-binding GntR family transcriptional regulator
MNLQETSYSRVASAIRHLIQDGKLQPGEKLPPEHALCKQFKLSRITIRRALQLLEGERLVESRRGSGTYVCPHPSYRIPLMIDYTGSIRLHAPKLGRRVIEEGLRAAGHEISVALSIPPSDVCLFSTRVDFLPDGTPMAWDLLHIAPPFYKGMKHEHLLRIDFIQTWARVCRFRIDYCRQSVEAIRSSSLDRTLLGIPAGRPILKTTEVFHARGGKPAGIYVTHYHSEHFYISSTFDWGTGSAIAQGTSAELQNTGARRGKMAFPQVMDVDRRLVGGKR